jgi:elongation factor Ts
MSTISAAAVKELRDRTNQPMMDCKRALADASGDMEKAIQLLRERGKGVAVSKGARETAEGRIVTFLDEAKKVGAIVEMRCESAPVAKSDQFVKLCSEIAVQVAYKDPKSVDELLAQPYVEDTAKTVKEHIDELVGTIRENMKPHRCARLAGLLGSYVHHDGTVGVLLQVEGEKTDPQVLRDVCMHIAAINPVSARRQDVPADVVQRETEIAKAQIANDPKNASKPANIIEKIAEGKVNAWFAENVLEEQPFVKDPSKKVGELLKAQGLKLVKFVRYKVGEITT